MLKNNTPLLVNATHLSGIVILFCFLDHALSIDNVSVLPLFVFFSSWNWNGQRKKYQWPIFCVPLRTANKMAGRKAFWRQVQLILIVSLAAAFHCLGLLFCTLLTERSHQRQLLQESNFVPRFFLSVFLPRLVGTKTATSRHGPVPKLKENILRTRLLGNLFSTGIWAVHCSLHFSLN